jgi:LmbE family N-acetylglucosaminyl deacetylase
MPVHYTRLADLPAHYSHIYLSPHFDDAALSCGGSIARFVAAEQPVLVVTICSGSPPADSTYSAFAQHQHTQWGVAPEQAMQQRLREDIEALETLGADSYQLDLLDAIYRCPEDYVNDATLFGSVAAHDPLGAALRDELIALHERYPQAIFYAPLAVGNHVDHQATYAAAQHLLERGAILAFYEDLPYAIAPQALEQRLATLGGGDHFLPTITTIDATLARKMSAIASYTSQIGVLFGTLEQMETQISRYAQQLTANPEHHGERIWMRR